MTKEFKSEAFESIHSSVEALLKIGAIDEEAMREFDTRECEFCRDRLEEFAQDGIICGACHGTRVLNIKDCFCHAYEPSECGCEADWSDYVELDYWEDEE